ncbi:Ig-like domain-containing protein [Halomonas denitrificans]|nr:Ig-like domain-containing protein [Halomonas denitrificans]
MNKPFQTRAILAAFLLTIFLAGCNSELAFDGTDDTTQLVRLEIAATDVVNGTLNLVIGEQIELRAIGHYSDGSSKTLTAGVSWSSPEGDVIKVTAEGLVTALTLGTATVSAEYTGIRSNTVEVRITNNNPLTRIQITPLPVTTQGQSTLTLAKGNAQPFIAVGYYEDGSSKTISNDVTWVSSDVQVAEFNPEGLLMAHRLGEVVVHATLKQLNSNTVSVHVTDATITAIQVTPSPLSLAKGHQQQLRAIATYSDQTTAEITEQVQWRVMDSTLATVSQSGRITAEAVGETILTAEHDGVTSPPVTVTVTNAVITAIQVTPSPLLLAQGQQQVMTAMALYSDHTTANITATADWVSDDERVATISSAGLLTAAAQGSTGISARQDNITSNVINVDVTPAVIEALQITPALIALHKGNRQAMTAQATYSDRTMGDVTDIVTWTAADTQVATIAPTGELRAMDIGRTNVTATIGEVVSNTAVVEVSKAVVTAIQVTPATMSLAKGRQEALTAIAHYSDNTTADITHQVAWHVVNNSIATVTTNGELNAVAEGATTVSASMDGINSNTASVTVTAAVVTAIEVTPSSLSLAKGNQQALTATATYSDGTSADISATVAWATADTSVATVTATGQLSAVTVGRTTVTASQAGIISTATTIEVTTAVVTAIEVTPALVSLAKGHAQFLTATATYSDGNSADISATVAWASADTSVATVTAAGQLSAVAVGQTTVTASQAGISSSAIMVEVTTAVVTAIEVTPAQVSLAKGNQQALIATATYSDGTSADISATVAWVSADTSVATVTATGQLDAVAMGQTTVTANQAGISSRAITVEVTAAVITAIEITPSSIVVFKGDSSQLVATATYSDGNRREVSSTVSWHVLDNRNVVTVSTSGLLAGVKLGDGSVQARADGVASNAVSIEVKPYLPICGHIRGNPIDTSPTGGLNNADSSNAAGNCVKVRQIVDPIDMKTKWFTATPSINAMNYLEYSASFSSQNTGDTYGRTWPEDGSSGPSGDFAGFRLDGKNVSIPGSGEGSQYDRWCKKLGAINFAGQANWRRTTLDEMESLYLYGPDVSSGGMYERLGWPTGKVYWASDTASSVGDVMDFARGAIGGGSSFNAFYASCVATF